jgi:FkbM family methyltransferase
VVTLTLTSYAQNHEDVLLARLFPPGVPGFFIDIGAMDPVIHSVTKLFSDRGWHGVNVEPAASPFERLHAARPRDINLNVGLSDHEGTLTLFESDPNSGWSTFSSDQAAQHRDAGIPLVERPVPVMTLAQVCQKYVTETIDFISIDVEGHERQVLEGGDWRAWRPRVVVVESTEPNTSITTHHQWEHILLEADYEFAAFDGLNRYYVRAEDEHLTAALATPVNVLDDYVPHRYESEISDLRFSLATAQRHLAASRALNATLSSEHAALLTEVASLRPKYHALQEEVLLLRDQYANVLVSTRAHYASVRESVLSSAVGLEQLRKEVVDARARTEAVSTLFDNIGQAGLGVARRLTKMSVRYPAAADASKKALGAALGLKRAAQRRKS